MSIYDTYRSKLKTAEEAGKQGIWKLSNKR